MSHDVSLTDPETGDLLEIDHHRFFGGTYALGGSNRCELNVTYNYGRIFADTLGMGFREFLDGKIAATVAPRLAMAVLTLGIERDDDYWNATNGNAGYALAVLLYFAVSHPTGVFRVV